MVIRQTEGPHFVYHCGRWWAGNVIATPLGFEWTTAYNDGSLLQYVPIGEVATITGPIPTPDDPRWKALVGR